MFGRQLTLFELFGFRVKVDLSWAFLAVFIAWSLAHGFFPTFYEGLPTAVYWWMGIAGVIGLFMSIVFHELSHSLVARRFGLPIRGITLFIFGGVAEMEEEPVSPKAEFLMAVAGPIASIVLAFAFYGVTVAAAALGFGEPVVAVTGYLAFLNGLLAAFNLVPAFPLDGGRMLRAGLWHWMGSIRRATSIASTIGSGFGFLLVALGILHALAGNFVGGIWWFLIGLFLRGAARTSYFQLMARRALEGEPVSRFMTEQPVTVTPETTVQALVEDYVYKYHHEMFPVIDGSRLVGCVSTREIRQVPRDQWGATEAGRIASECSPANTIEPTKDAVKALAQMQQTGSSRLMVAQGGNLVGIVTLKDMLRLLALKMDLEPAG